MRLVPVLNREAFVLVSLYDLECPFSPLLVHPHVYYLDPGLAKLLYARYLLDKNGSWDEAFEAVLRGVGGGVVEVLRSVEVYRWEEIERVLAGVAGRVLELHGRVLEKFIRYTRAVFGFERYFDEVYVVFGFNPLLHASYGNGMERVKRFPVVACFVNDSMGAEGVLDVVYHEVLHRLIRLNGLGLSEKVEEVLLEFMCPEGYLSELLGLGKRRVERGLPPKYEWFKEEYELLRRRVEEYFEGRVYERATIIEYLGDLLKKA